MRRSHSLLHIYKPFGKSNQRFFPITPQIPPAHAPFPAFKPYINRGAQKQPLPWVLQYRIFDVSDDKPQSFSHLLSHTFLSLTNHYGGPTDQTQVGKSKGVLQRAYKDKR